MPLNIKLRHFVLGVVFNKTVHQKEEEKTINYLRNKYGKKFEECEVEVLNVTPCQVIFLPTERVYKNISTAVKGTKYTKYEIQKHLDGNLPENIKPLFQYYEKDKDS